MREAARLYQQAALVHMNQYWPQVTVFLTFFQSITYNIDSAVNNSRFTLLLRLQQGPCTRPRRLPNSRTQYWLTGLTVAWALAAAHCVTRLDFAREKASPHALSEIEIVASAIALSLLRGRHYCNYMDGKTLFENSIPWRETWPTDWQHCCIRLHVK